MFHGTTTEFVIGSEIGTSITITMPTIPMRDSMTQAATPATVNRLSTSPGSAASRPKMHTRRRERRESEEPRSTNAVNGTNLSVAADGMIELLTGSGLLAFTSSICSCSSHMILSRETRTDDHKPDMYLSLLSPRSGCIMIVCT